MKAHVKLYLDYFKYDLTDFIPCEVCGFKATDIHHIKARGMGGSTKLNIIENLQALCRSCHIEYGDKKKYMDFLRQIHATKMLNLHI